MPVYKIIKILIISSVLVFIIYTHIDLNKNSNYTREKQNGINFELLNKFLILTYGQNLQSTKTIYEHNWTHKKSALLYWILINKDKVTKRQALKVINKAGFNYASIIPFLIDLLSDEDDEVRKLACMNLRRITHKNFGSNVNMWKHWMNSLPPSELILRWLIVLLPLILCIIFIIQVLYRKFEISTLCYLPIPVVVFFFTYYMCFYPSALFSDYIRISKVTVYFLYFGTYSLSFCSSSVYLIAKIKILIIFGTIVGSIIFGIYHHLRMRRKIS